MVNHDLVKQECKLFEKNDGSEFEFKETTIFEWYKYRIKEFIIGK